MLAQQKQIVLRGHGLLAAHVPLDAVVLTPEPICQHLDFFARWRLVDARRLRSDSELLREAKAWAGDGPVYALDFAAAFASYQIEVRLIHEVTVPAEPPKMPGGALVGAITLRPPGAARPVPGVRLAPAQF